MLTVSLTSVPPRFGGLTATLQSLVAQDEVSAVIVCLPRSYARFPGPVSPPVLPAGVTLRWTEQDIGPATKILPVAADHAPDAPILYCDDDWTYGPGWARQFALAHMADPTAAHAASPFDTARLGHPGGQIAQGFAGVLVTPTMLAPLTPPPERFRVVDDIWLSGLLARNGVPIRAVQHARDLAKPSGNEAAPLQQDADRAALNRACAGFVSDRFRVWSQSASAP